MLHKTLSTPFRSSSTLVVQPEQNQNPVQQTPRLLVISNSGGAGTPGTPAHRSSALIDLLSVSANRCSTFFAEAAVLVLVLALLDRFMVKGTMEMSWVVSALGISIALLLASIATDFSARRWLTQH